jgi:hypothetical protein
MKTLKLKIIIIGMLFINNGYSKSETDISCGVGALYLLNCNVGFEVKDNFGVEIYAGTSGLINTVPIYFDYINGASGIRVI